MSQQSSPHDGKHFVVQKGKAQCNQGDQFPQYKVTSHQHHFWNDSDGNADFLAVTEDDLQFNPSGSSFGKCKLKPSSGGNLPCSYASSGKWQKTYEKVKILGKKIVTEASELQCTVGGKITIKDHGQRGQMSKQNVKSADSKTLRHINPLVNIQNYKETVLESEIDAY
jgi:phage-related tail fiber protein